MHGDLKFINILVGKPDRKRQPGMSRRRLVDNIQMDIKEIGCETVDWIKRAEVRIHWLTLLNTVIMNLRFP
jgi:hypothetical protein